MAKKCCTKTRKYEEGGKLRGMDAPSKRPLAFRPATDVAAPAGPKVPSGARSATGTGSGNAVAKPRSRAVTRPGRPTIDVDMPKRLAGEKVVEGRRIPNPQLEGPKGVKAAGAAGAAGRTAGGLGALARMGTGLGLLTYSSDVGKGSDKPPRSMSQDTGTAMENVFPATNEAGKKALAKGSSESFMKGERDFPQGRSKPSISVPKRPGASRPRATADDDEFLNELRASAAKMKSATSEAARETGRMKGAMEEFQSAATDAEQGFKRGGRVGGRGDGKAVRGRTKGRFI